MRYGSLLIEISRVLDLCLMEMVPVHTGYRSFVRIGKVIDALQKIAYKAWVISLEIFNI